MLCWAVSGALVTVAFAIVLHIIAALTSADVIMDVLAKAFWMPVYTVHEWCSGPYQDGEQLLVLIHVVVFWALTGGVFGLVAKLMRRRKKE